MSRRTYAVQRGAIVVNVAGCAMGVIVTNWGQLPDTVLSLIFVVLALISGVLWMRIQRNEIQQRTNDEKRRENARRFRQVGSRD